MKIKKKTKNYFEKNPKNGFGYIYILHNESMPELYKVGKTINSVKSRAEQLNSTGVPTKFLPVEIFQVPIDFMDKIEKTAHAKLKKDGYHFNKEFFRARREELIRVVQDTIFELTEIRTRGIVGQAEKRAAINSIKIKQAKTEETKKQRAIERKTALHREKIAAEQKSIEEENYKILNERIKEKEFILSIIDSAPEKIKKILGLLFFAFLGAFAVLEISGKLIFIIGPLFISLFYKLNDTSERDSKINSHLATKFPLRSINQTDAPGPSLENKFDFHDTDYLLQLDSGISILIKKTGALILIPIAIGIIKALAKSSQHHPIISR